LSRETVALLASNLPPRNLRECRKAKEYRYDRKRQQPSKATAELDETEKNGYWKTPFHGWKNSKYCGGQAKHPANQNGS
jgi:hypothetical protein